MAGILSTGAATRVDTEADLEAGMRHLAEVCPVMAGVITLTGRPPLRRRPGGFAGLVQIVLGQQVSVASARAIEARLVAAYPGLPADRLAAASAEELAAAGLSRSKIRTVQRLASAVADGAFDPAVLGDLSPERAHARLVGLPGIGPWTADIYALACLGQGDAFAPGDLALQEAARLLFALEARPNTAELADLAERWRPWRAVAARLLWAYYAKVKAREGLVTQAS